MGQWDSLGPENRKTMRRLSEVRRCLRRLSERHGTPHFIQPIPVAGTKSGFLWLGKDARGSWP